ncbi:DUF429 domain-containing protein [Paenibacillus sp. TAB 01]|uniref:DUF429 domain-containing protein n=1 Tax=Paenibacillus sp. TAB 01 TaxID=3368988 RepID=UPI00375385E5
MTSARKFVGVDGCRGGWIAVALETDGSWAAEIYPKLLSVWERNRDAALFLVDMPIGLASGSHGGKRRCDGEARQRLKPFRASSIFSAPIREALAAGSYAEANALSRQLTGAGLSKQAWNLAPKIREADALARLLLEGSGSPLFESHPELCLAELFGGPMRHNKKTPQGFDERLSHISRLFPEAPEVVACAMERFRRKDAARDDIVDALVLAAAAWSGGGRLEQVPAEPEYDACGLPMRIVFAPPGPRSAFDQADVRSHTEQ